MFWHPNGALVRHQIETYWKDLHLRKGYQLVYSPHIAKIDLWKTSGHFDFYKESMFNQMKVCVCVCFLGGCSGAAGADIWDCCLGAGDSMRRCSKWGGEAHCV